MKSKILTANDIRKSVLQLAIQGKLVKHDPSDEPASKLIERSEQISKINHIEIEDGPFEIPHHWKWVKFPEIAYFWLGKTPEREDTTMWGIDIPWVSIADMKDKQTINNTKEFVANKSINSCFKKISPKGTLLMSFKLTVGRVSILGMDAVHNEAIISIEPYIKTENIIKNYLFFILGFMTQFCEKTDAIKGVTLNKKKISDMLIPLPPLEEQKRIVDKINKIEKLLVEYEKIEKKLSYLEDNIEEQLKKSILQYAIQGKLVKQDPNDEPASKLIERIYKEKQKLIKEGIFKKDKNESYIFGGDDGCFYEKVDKSEPVKINVPFETPGGWEWIRASNLINVLSGTSYKKDDICNSGLRILRGGNIKNFEINLQDNDVFLPEHQYLQTDKLIAKHDIVIVASTGSKEIIGNPAFVYDLIPNCSIGAFLRIIRPKFEWCFNYLTVLFKTDYYRNIIRKETVGTCINNLGSNLLLNILVPLPPLEEQKRIVDKINILWGLLNE